MSIVYAKKLVLRYSLYLVALSAVVAGTVSAQQRPAAKGEWLNYGLDFAETRYSALNQIDTTNASRLGLAWSYDIGVGGGMQEATPLVWNGVMYGITNWSITFAVDARTGKERWRWDPQVDQDATRAKICCGVVNRGLALLEGKIFVPVIDGRLVALDAMTGKVVWQAQVSSVQDNYTITMAPRIAKDKVVIGVAGGEYPVRGYFDAYDVNTGKRSWRFYTVPGDPSKPFENDAMKRAAATWSADAWKLGGGGAIWDAISYDAEADLIYVGTGNGGPWPEVLRNSKGMDNLYVCSIVAVKGQTGELKWYFQSVPGDSWDYDAVQQITLADIAINGRRRKVLMQAQKNGFFYVLDRITGEFISAAPFATVTWAKGVDPKTGRPIVNPEAIYGAESVVVSPAPGGGHNWAAMSFNPITGLMYIPSTLYSTWNFSVDQNFVYKPGRWNMGLGTGGNGGGTAAAAQPVVPGHPNAAADPGAATPTPPTPAKPSEPRRAAPAIGPAATPGQSGSVLLAWDPVAQKERWRRPGGGGIGGGCLTTAGNLVIQVVPEGRLVIYSADKGEKLFDIDTGLKGGMGAPMTYEIDGKQYISLMGGRGVLARFGPNVLALGATPPASALVPPRLLTFVLDGKAALPGAPRHAP
jgi:quinohemoprotein ethanol dehydrogenase